MRVATTKRSLFERFYSLVILIKGLDAAVELVIGAVLLVAPSVVQRALAAVSIELGEGVGAWQRSVADAVADAGEGLSGGAVALAAFLMVHGIVKLATVYCLLRRIVRAYPWAIAVLTVLLAVQLVSAVAAPTLGAWVLAALDVLVIVLVGLEYRRLRRESRLLSDARSGRLAAAER